MKNLLSFVIILSQTLLCKAFLMQGFECFCHDTPQQLVNNNCFINIVQIFNNNNLPNNDLFTLNNSSYQWNFNNIPQQPIPLNALPIQQQATIAIHRFCLGITNGRNLPAFQNLPGLFQAYLGNQAQNIQRALAAGGYNTPSAQFLHALLAPGGIPPGIVGQADHPNDTISVILKLRHRASKDLKEIHWSSSSALGINLNLWNAFLGALGLAVNVNPPLYVSIKQRINAPFVMVRQQPPNSATFVLYDETSIN